MTSVNHVEPTRMTFVRWALTFLLLAAAAWTGAAYTPHIGLVLVAVGLSAYAAIFLACAASVPSET